MAVDRNCLGGGDIVADPLAGQGWETVFLGDSVCGGLAKSGHDKKESVWAWWSYSIPSWRKRGGHLGGALVDA